MIYDNLLSFVSAGLNRKWRGEGQAPRPVWYAFMAIIAFVNTGDWRFAAFWVVFLLAYALLPWQAMFSAIHGNPPSRQDSWYVQWMQTLAFKLSSTPNPWNGSVQVAGVSYRKFGVVYGAIRALPMVCVSFYFAGYYHSLVPLVGLLFLLMGYVYYKAADLSNYFIKTVAIAVPIAEISMGYFIMEYMMTLKHLI